MHAVAGVPVAVGDALVLRRGLSERGGGDARRPRRTGRARFQAAHGAQTQTSVLTLHRAPFNKMGTRAKRSLESKSSITRSRPRARDGCAMKTVDAAFGAQDRPSRWGSPRRAALLLLTLPLHAGPWLGGPLSPPVRRKISRRLHAASSLVLVDGLLTSCVGVSLSVYSFAHSTSSSRARLSAPAESLASHHLLMNCSASRYILPPSASQLSGKHSTSSWPARPGRC